MNRTSKLMTAVTASLCLTGALPVPGTVVPAFGRTATQSDESGKTDPQVQKAADAIEAWMNEGNENCCSPDPKTLQTMTHTQDDVIKKFSQFNPTLVQQALKELVHDGSIKQKGDGSKDNPFRYTVCSSSGS